jgi:excisionase family DNA binding protein
MQNLLLRHRLESRGLTFITATAFCLGEVIMEYGDVLEAIIRKIVREELAAQSQGITAAPLPETFSEDEFCKRIGISKTTARELRRKGKLKFMQIGRRVLYTPDHVSEFLQSNERKRKRK